MYKIKIRTFLNSILIQFFYAEVQNKVLTSLFIHIHAEVPEWPNGIGLGRASFGVMSQTAMT